MGRGKREGRSKWKAISSAEKRRSSPVAAVAPRKIGILCHSMAIDKGGDYEVNLYVVNIDSQIRRCAFPTATPAVRFTFPNRYIAHALCVVNSTVYLFGGYTPYAYKPPESKDKYARKFALPEEIDGRDLKVKEENLDRIPVMNFPKAFPRAIPTPNGKQILVFGTYLGLNSDGAFELYNVEGCYWEMLPRLSYSCFDCRVVHGRPSCLCFDKIKSYSFIDEVNFFVVMEVGSFILNIVDKRWTTVAIAIKLGLHYDIADGDPFVTVVNAMDQFALTKEGICYYLEDDGVFFAEKHMGIQMLFWC